ncbi:hypothetical protein [Deinococcus koreensis]|uniref:Uncharacterized protein n=1 Tax=Deinococcus koreensis TaxID=2054903 RepID=A0A2K3UTH3_9DEIO|nr:hypothetical protein [Deinococcus koreensis]PNY79844.1 hypothetical protein CVO96_18060 [Deinococcus koreensis]
MTKRVMTVHKYRLGEEPPERDYWLTRTMEERVMEVFRLRAMWGADREPMVREVTSIHRLGEKGRRAP